MLTILMSLISFITGFYNLQFTDTDNNTISMTNFQHRKVLLVNIATESPRATQLAELKQLQEQFADSLIVIAFPSNSFGNEPRSNSEIKQFCQSTYNTNFLLAAKDGVAGTTTQAVYQWLANESANGQLSLSISGDFQKVLISEQGELVGFFSPKISPLDISVINAIRTDYRSE